MIMSLVCCSNDLTGTERGKEVARVRRSMCVIYAVEENVRRLTAELLIIARSLSEKMIERPHK